MDQFNDFSSICDLWDNCERELGVSSNNRVTFTQLDPFRRIYIDGDQVIKVEFLDRMPTATKRRRDLVDEFQIYKECECTRGIGRAIELRKKNGYTVLYLERIFGEPFDVERASWARTFSVVIQLLITSVRLARLGIAHNDFVPSNILMGASGAVTLVDFDQATKSSQLSALTRGMFGFPDKEIMVTTSVFHIVRMKLRAIVRQNLPDRVIVSLRAIKRGVSRKQNARLLPKLPANASNCQRAFLVAWKIAQRSVANAPGAGLAYYEVEVDGVIYPGERPWDTRWQVLKGVVSYGGQRVLELGCNMGLLSSYLIKHEGAQAALATDIDEDILKAARTVAMAMHVSVEFDVIDFNSENDWELRLERFQPDVVFALNVLNWVNNKERLLSFLGRFDCVVFEGHDDFEIEKGRFNSVGFRQIDLISISERDRPLMLCRK